MTIHFHNALWPIKATPSSTETCIRSVLEMHWVGIGRKLPLLASAYDGSTQCTRKKLDAPGALGNVGLAVVISTKFQSS